jgi:hypothetical protein
LLEAQVGESVYYWIDLCMADQAYTALPPARFNWQLWNLWMHYKVAPHFLPTYAPICMRTRRPTHAHPDE